MPAKSSFGETHAVLDRAIRRHLAKLGHDLLVAASGPEDQMWPTMGRTARSLARLGRSGPAGALDHDASDEETYRYHVILKALAEA